MRSKNIAQNLAIYFLLFFFLLFALYFISYKIFNTYFTSIENAQNSKALEHFIQNLNNEVKNIDKLALDYAHWDNTYDFMQGLNDEFIYNNFRQGTNTLNDLELDFIIFASKANRIAYSKYIDNFQADQYKFEKRVFTTLTEFEDSASIISINKKYFIVVKRSILESDAKGSPSGYLYMGVALNNSTLKKLTSVFDNVHIIQKRVSKAKIITSKNFIKKIKVQSDYKTNTIFNYLEIKDIRDNFLFTIETQYKRDIINSGKDILILFNLLITLLFAFVFYLLVKHQKTLVRQNFELDRKVLKKTFELNKTLKTLKKKNKELFTLAHMDTLTRIHNRRSFFALSSKAIEESKRKNTPLTTLMIDIDYFKNINDTYGHKIGDLVLKDFAKRVSSLLDESTIFGRLGGEEFAVMLPNKSLEEVEKIAETIREKVESSFIQVDLKTIKYTASFGLCSYKKEYGIDDVLHEADELLYEAKKRGRNRVVRQREKL